MFFFVPWIATSVTRVELDVPQRPSHFVTLRTLTRIAMLDLSSLQTCYGSNLLLDTIDCYSSCCMPGFMCCSATWSPWWCLVDFRRTKVEASGKLHGPTTPQLEESDIYSFSKWQLTWWRHFLRSKSGKRRYCHDKVWL